MVLWVFFSHLFRQLMIQKSTEKNLKRNKEMHIMKWLDNIGAGGLFSFFRHKEI